MFTYWQAGYSDKGNKMDKVYDDVEIRLTHVMGYIKAMVSKDKKTMQDAYPVQMSEGQKDFIMGHLQYIRNSFR